VNETVETPVPILAETHDKCGTVDCCGECDTSENSKENNDND
jgi:hypothetical protein